jgi:WD40 repeat protein
MVHRSPLSCCIVLVIHKMLTKRGQFDRTNIAYVIFLAFCLVLPACQLRTSDSFDFAVTHVTSEVAVTPSSSRVALIQANSNIGNVQPFSLGDVIIRTGIQGWHDAGWKGSGQKIGVLDRGFSGLADFEKQFGVNIQLAPGQHRDTYNATNIAHGTYVIEILYTIAPSARLYSCQYDDFTEFVPCVNWMISNGVKIINHSVGIPSLPLDGTNEWALEVDRAAKTGVIWINAAGNFANGYIADFFTDTNGNTYHEFRGTNGLETLSVGPINEIEGLISLSWQGSSVAQANAIDLDLEILDSQGNLVRSSNQPQNGRPGETAIESLLVPAHQQYFIRIRDSNAKALGVRLVLFVEFASIPSGQADRSIIAPGDSQNAVTVGAMQGNIIAPYSSRGPVDSGAIKPDLVAPGEVILNNGQQFIGTSVAAPIVAGLVALIWEANPVFSREEVISFLKQRAIQDDAYIAGPDNVYGAGALYLPMPEITPTPFPSLTPSITAVPTPTLTLMPTATQTEIFIPTITASLDHPLAVVMVELANIRSGPGSIFNIITSVEEGARLPIIAQAYDTTWYLVSLTDASQGWIPASVVALEPNGAIVQIAATIPANSSVFLPTSTDTPSVTSSPERTTVSSIVALTTLSGHTDNVNDVAWSSDDSLLVSASLDRRILVWDTTNYQAMATLGGHTGNVYSVSWLSSTEVLAAGTTGSVVIWDSINAKVITTIPVDGWVSSVAWSPDGNLLAYGTGDGQIEILDLIQDIHIGTYLGDKRNDVNSISWSPDGRFIAADSFSNTISIWNVQTGELVRNLSGHSADVNALSWSPNGAFIASGSRDNNAIIWNVDTGDLITLLTGHTDWIHSISWSPTGDLLASGSRDRTVIVWDVPLRQKLYTLTGHSHWIHDVAWSHDGTLIASGSVDKNIIIWSVQ